MNYNFRQSSESKHMYIWYISTNRVDLTPIGRIWPEFDLLWPRLTLKNIESEFLRIFRVETHVYLIYFDQPGRFDPYWTDLTRVWPLMTPIDLEKYWIWILEKISSRNICIFDIFRPTGPIWPLLDRFDPSLTSDDPDWPWKILNLNSWENFESKHMYIGYISTNPPDLTLIRRFWPYFWPKMVKSMKND